jgi:hypothetical protein
MERQECLSDVGSRKGIYVNRVKKPRRRRQKNKNTSTQLNLDAVAHVSSPEKYVSQNLNNNMGGIDKDVMMEKVLAENRRLTLLMQKMSKGSDSAASAERFGLGGDENDGRVINSMDYFGDEMDGELDDSLEFGSLYSPNPKVGPRSDGGHKLFVDQILGVSSDYLSQGKSPAKVRGSEERSDELATSSLATKTTRARTSVQGMPLLYSPQ